MEFQPSCATFAADFKQVVAPGAVQPESNESTKQKTTWLAS